MPDFLEKKVKENLVGISDMGIVIPEFFIGVEKIAKEKELPVEYVNGGLGLLEARISYNASLPELMIKAVQKIKFSDVERFFIATESDYDFSKAVAAIKTINKGLNLTEVPFQLKFACLAGTQALILASEYAFSQGKPAIVIVADRSIYKDSKAEVTQGCAVVAIRIEKNPKLLALDFKNYGQYAEDIDDFKIPIKTAPFPELNGPLTKPAYMKCVFGAFENYKKRNPQAKELLDEIDYFAMHTPFPKIVVWVTAALWHYENKKDEAFIQLLQKCIEHPEFFADFKKLFDQTRVFPQFQKFFQKKVKPSLKYNSRIGNCYNVSIFISLLSILEKITKGEHVLITGYGSGSGSLVLRGQAMSNGFENDLEEQLKRGKELTIFEYRQWKDNLVKKIRGFN